MALVRANRCTVAIYRNAKGVKGRGVDGGAFDNNNVRYSAVTGLLSAQQPTLVAFSGTEANLDAALTPPGFTTRTSTDAVGGSAPGIGLHDKTVAIGDDTQPLADVATSSATDTFSVTLIVEAGTPGLSAETSSFQTTLSGDIHVRTFIPRRATFRAELTNVLTLYSSFYDAGSGSFAASVPQLTPTLASTWQRIALATRRPTSMQVLLEPLGICLNQGHSLELKAALLRSWVFP